MTLTRPAPVITIAIALMLLAPAGLAAVTRQAPAAPNWDPQLAAEIARQYDTRAAASELNQLLYSADSGQVLQALSELERRADWPVPAREAALATFAESLRGVPRDAVPEAVLDRLKAYRPRTLVPHHDRADVGEPMFRIGALVHGVENGWTYDEAALQGGRLAARGPMEFLGAWRRADSLPKRNGLLDGLRVASPEAVAAVHQQAMMALGTEPAIAPLAARSALATGDVGALQLVILQGDSAMLPHTLRQAAAQLHTQEAANIFLDLLDAAPAPRVALVLGAWAPMLVESPEVEARLLTLLDHPELGSAAALTLSKQPSVAALEALDRISRQDENWLAADRAWMALDLYEQGLLEGWQ
ncbi:MAG: hypothetical protein R3233_03870 [Xanthomonadales bacterium]|nr:hypothetical protein [Xanthomonadales bacterium]